MINGQFIGVQEKCNTFVLEKVFKVEVFQSAVLRVTALGVYFAQLNGARVGRDYLAPGWTSYNKTLQVQEYDVAPLLKKGENILALTVNDGWYCGRLTWNSITNTYGSQSAVCAELIVDDTVVLSTDPSWHARESTIRESGLYDGEAVNLLAPCADLQPVPVDFDKARLCMQLCEPVRTVERRPVSQMIHTPNGEWIYDFGQNLVGVVEVSVPSDFCGTIQMQFSEILINGNFYTENLRTARATDSFTVCGPCVVSPEFTFHGFRYLKLEGAAIPPENVCALIRHTDMQPAGRIQTSNPRFQRMCDNVVWGQRGNFVDIPTDCPQRDERLGWTGDINAFCRTAAFNYDIRGIMQKWLKTLRDDQLETGEVPFVVPDCLGDRATDAMWCDVVTFVPWALYEMYGDVSFLTDNFDAMEKFMEARERTFCDGMIAKGHEFGDWLALDGEPLFAESPVGRTDVYFLTNACQVESLRIVAEAAEILGKHTKAHQWKEKREALLKRMRHEYFTPSGRLAIDTVTAHAVALHFGIVSPEYRKRVAGDLNNSVIRHRYCMSTGFIGSPFLLFALADNGYFETARRVLLNSGYPGWLYEVDMGATTIWERWNSLMPDGSPNPDGMNSYNHYAYGSFLEFVYRRIAGIEPLLPGFERIRIAPNPAKGVPELKARYNSIHGSILSQYVQREGKITFAMEVPDGVSAEICLPGEDPFWVEGGSYVWERPWEDLEALPFTEESLVAEVLDNPKAHEAFACVFGTFIDHVPWAKHDRVTLAGMAKMMADAGEMEFADLQPMLEKANALFLQKVQL